MAAEGLFFRGEYLMRFLAGELDRARFEITYHTMSEMQEHYGNDVQGSLYSKYVITPLTISEENIQSTETKGFRDRNPFLVRPASSSSSYAIACRVTEYRVPFEGDERLFRFTTCPFPFYPFGRLEDGNFVICVKDGEDHFLNDYDYQLALLKECVSISSAAVKCYNSDLKAMIEEMVG